MVRINLVTHSVQEVAIRSALEIAQAEDVVVAAAEYVIAACGCRSAEYEEKPDEGYRFHDLTSPGGRDHLALEPAKIVGVGTV